MKILLSVPLLLLVFQNTKYVRVNIGDMISIKIPDSFIRVPPEQMINRHVHFRQPLALYTDVNNDVDLSFNQNPTRWRESDIQVLKDFYKSNIMSLYDQVEFTREEVVEIRGKKFVVFEFISTLRGDPNSIRNTAPLKKYTYIQYSIHNGSTLVANFTSSFRSRQIWANVANEVMSSMAIK